MDIVIFIAQPHSKNKEEIIRVNTQMTVGELKEIYYNIVGSRKNNQWIYEAEVLNDEKTLSSYEIMNYDIIEAIPSSRGGGGDGIDMADISNEKGLIENNYGKNAKKWNYIIKGLNITGKYENEGCEAYNLEVDCQIGLGKFDLVRDADEINCPMCKNLIQPITCTFCKCNYRLDGKKRFKKENGKLKIEKS